MATQNAIDAALWHVKYSFPDRGLQSLREVMFEYNERADVTRLLPPRPNSIDFDAQNVHITEEAAKELQLRLLDLPNLEVVRWRMLTADGPMTFGLKDQERLKELFHLLWDKGILNLS